MQVAVLREELALKDARLEHAIHGRCAAEDMAARFSAQIEDLRSSVVATEAARAQVSARLPTLQLVESQPQPQAAWISGGHGSVAKRCCAVPAAGAGT